MDKINAIAKLIKDLGVNADGIACLLECAGAIVDMQAHWNEKGKTEEEIKKSCDDLFSLVDFWATHLA